LIICILYCSIAQKVKQGNVAIPSQIKYNILM
jgi:hypothetical protein